MLALTDAFDQPIGPACHQSGCCEGSRTQTSQQSSAAAVGSAAAPIRPDSPSPTGYGTGVAAEAA